MEPVGLISGFKKSYLFFPSESTAWVGNYTPSSHSKAMDNNFFSVFPKSVVFSVRANTGGTFKVRLRNGLLRGRTEGSIKPHALPLSQERKGCRSKPASMFSPLLSVLSAGLRTCEN